MKFLAPGPEEGKPIPKLEASQLNKKRFTLTTLRGQPIALFFFCGCQACWDLATEWNRLQRAEVLRNQAPGLKRTVIVYVDMSPSAAESLARATGWEGESTLPLVDTNDIARKAYQAEPCPRVFVADSRHILRYTNSHPYDQPQKAPVAAIAAFCLDALKRVAAKPIPNQKESQ
ncbi:MAG: redoxin domain-containing protein [Armatimonas sp.]